MAMNVNKVILGGKLTRDIEVRAVGTTKVGTGSMATNKKFKDKNGEWKDKGEFHNLKFWGSKAEAAERYLKKGSSVYIEGELETESWEKDGKMVYKTVVVVNDMQFLDSAPSIGGSAGNGQAYNRPQNRPTQNRPQQQFNAPPAFNDEEEAAF